MSQASRQIFVTIIVALALLAPLATTRGQSPVPGSVTLDLAQNTLIPPRDRIDLARRVLGITNIPDPPAVAPPELAIGDRQLFWAHDLGADTSFQVEAALAYKTDHVYMFVEVGADYDPAAIQRSADAFETVIRPTIHRVFGSEWFPGIDGDPHLYILHARNLGNWVAAYYGSDSQYPSEAVANSNEHEMFYVNLDAMGQSIGTPYYEGVLAHEFQHMVQWRVDGNEDTWLNEGLSELAVLLTGYGASNFAPLFLSEPAIQLTYWPEDNNRGAHYGAAFMFLAYLYQRYGDTTISTLVSDPANGMTSVENALAASNITSAPVTAVDIFADWLVANRLMDVSVGDGRYGYTIPEIQDLPQAAITREIAPDSGRIALAAPQWGPHYLHIPGGATAQTARITFQGHDSVAVVPTTAHSGTHLWWSNRADHSDTRLTRAFDLTGVTAATLNFWTWYHIEELWDYAYVMISTDDGVTWTPLRSARMTDEDPHGNAYGPGYTGQSNGWALETIDLTPYAGQNVRIRFEYITDDAVTQPGLIIDDVSIPEIGYFDDAETAVDGWISEGWLRMDNVLPQRFVVQLVQPGRSDAPVMRLLGPDDLPQGDWTITLGGEWGDATVIVSGIAPITTEPAQYAITVEAQ